MDNATAFVHTVFLAFIAGMLLNIYLAMPEEPITVEREGISEMPLVITPVSTSASE